jgi:uroporphyrinogen decarboxylase
MNKREVVLNLLDSSTNTPYTPAGFFLHFNKRFHRGQAAVDKHLEFFQYTGMDFVKIQYELSIPHQQDIKKPDDWSKMPLMGTEFYQDQWEIANGLVESAGKEALVIMTLYSPFMLAGQAVGRELVDEHIRENPDQFKNGMEILTESMLIFIKGCIEKGIDGFYHSTQGAETNRFGGSHLFDECIKPYDLAIMEEINNLCDFNILHICDYHAGYTDLSPFLDYPGDFINCSLNLGSKKITGKDVSKMFNRPFMGGLDRKGIIVTGSPVEIEREVDTALNDAPDDFILGADCTLPGDINWDNIKTAIAYAHAYGRL